LDVFVSKTDVEGESDLVVLLEDDLSHERFALLIEDKISAPFQPDQELRYRNRGKSAVVSGEFAKFEVILCAPRFYFDNQPKSELFDAFVSYEQIAAFMRENDQTPRGEYRASFIETAAVRSVNAWVKVEDDQTRDFWNMAYRIASDEFKILEMKKPDLTKGATWINFRPHDLPTKPKRTYINLKGGRGQVDLTFSRTNAAEFDARVRSLLEPEMSILQTSESAAIRIETDAFMVTDSLDIGAAKVRAAFAASERLIRFYRKHRDELDRAAIEAPLLVKSRR
jgi:hypothetical protein